MNMQSRDLVCMENLAKETFPENNVKTGFEIN